MNILVNGVYTKELFFIGNEKDSETYQNDVEKDCHAKKYWYYVSYSASSPMGINKSVVLYVK